MISDVSDFTFQQGGSDDVPKKKTPEELPNVATTCETVIDLELIVAYKKDLTELAKFKDTLEKRGWCFIKLSKWDAKHVKELFKGSEEFFKLSKEDKMKYHYPPDFGFSDTSSGFKQGFKVLTGPYIVDTNLPSVLDAQLNRVSERMDSVCKNITTATAEIVFGSTAEEILEREQIPLMEDLSSDHDFFSNKNKGYGMFDIAYYTNKSGQENAEGKDGDGPSKVREKNVMAHGDPGLFSISLGSTAPGLEMLDPDTGEWIKVENDQTVFWLGTAAMDLTQEKLKSGIHRVTYGDQSRLTMWYEACALDQIPESVRRNGVTSTDDLERKKMMETEKAFTIQVEGVSSWRSTEKLTTLEGIKPSMTIYEVMLKITDIEGLPPSKMMLSPSEEGKQLKAKAKRASGVYGSSQLEHDKLVSDYGIKAGDVISMLSSRKNMRHAVPQMKKKKNDDKAPRKKKWGLF